MSGVRERLRGALRGAMKARDKTAVSALRSTLAAIDNAEAVDAGPAPVTGAEHARVAGAIPGVGTAEVPRGDLSEGDVEAIVRDAISECEGAAVEYETTGHPDMAERLRHESRILSGLLDEGSRR